MSVPLTVRDEVIGVLNVRGRLAGGDFSSHDLSILAVMASHAAGAIDDVLGGRGVTCAAHWLAQRGFAGAAGAGGPFALEYRKYQR